MDWTCERCALSEDHTMCVFPQESGTTIRRCLPNKLNAKSTPCGAEYFDEIITECTGTYFPKHTLLSKDS